MVSGAARVSIALFGGAFVAVSLLWLMQRMLLGETVARLEEQPRPVMEFVRLKRESETQLNTRELPPEPPRAQEKPPLPPLSDSSPLDVNHTPPKFVFDAPTLELDISGPFIGAVRQGPPDRDFMVRSRVPPRYPYQAERKGIEGWVKVSFLITEHGDVQDVVVVDAQPAGVFDSAAARAVMKWKFKPRIVDGKAVSVRAEQVVSFRLDKKRR